MLIGRLFNEEFLSCYYFTKDELIQIRSDAEKLNYTNHKQD